MAASRLLPGVGFIMGCATGIGQATAVAFAKAGVQRLVLADINTKGMLATANQIRQEHSAVKIETFEVDVSDETSINNCVKEAATAFGRIDYALNNVGIGGRHIPTDQQNITDLTKVLNINLVGLWLSQKAQVKQMLTQEPLELPSGRGNRGVITNTASILGLVGGPEGASPYAASKHAILGMTKTEAASYAKQGVRINAICPGYVSTPILGDGDPQKRAAIETAIVPQVPMGRLGVPEEIADAVVFLSSHMASYVSGTALVVDGGYTSV